MIKLFRRWRAQRDLRIATQARIAALELEIRDKEAALVQARYEQSRDRIARALAVEEGFVDPVDSPATHPTINWGPLLREQLPVKPLADIVRDARQRIAEEHALRFDLTPLDLQYLMEMEQAFQKGGSHEFAVS